jgi:hypothetical protein
MGAVDAHLYRDGLLAEPRRDAMPAQIRAEDPAYVHRRKGDDSAF